MNSLSNNDNNNDNNNFDKDTLQKLQDSFIKFTRATIGLDLYPYQYPPAKYILYSILKHDGSEYVLEWSRQSGKSTTMACITAFVATSFPILFPDQFLTNPPRIGIFAPKFEQTAIIYTRALQALSSEFVKDTLGIQFRTIGSSAYKKKHNITKEADPRRDGVELSNGAIIRTYSASDKANIEGATLDIAIIDEAQNISDTKLKSAIFPMLSATNGVRVLIGTPQLELRTPSGQVATYFYQRTTQLHEPYFWCIDYQIASQSNPKYKEFVLSEMQRIGFDSDEFQTQFALKWVLQRSRFISLEQLQKLYDYSLSRGVFLPNEAPCVAGYDVGKSVDSTVLTFITRLANGKYVIRDWLELQGDNFYTQFNTIQNYLQTHQELKLVAMAIDTVGMGEPVFDYWYNLPTRSFDVVPINNSPKLRHEMYRKMQITFEQGNLIIPAQLQDTAFNRFVLQFLELEKIYTSDNYLKLTHPNKRNAHDDYPISLALALYIADNYLVDNTLSLDTLYSINNSNKLKEIFKDNLIEGITQETGGRNMPEIEQIYQYSGSNLQPEADNNISNLFKRIKSLEDLYD